VPQPWRKLGRVLEASGAASSRSHVMLPTPHVMADRVRVFYASCDDDLRGRIFFADFAPEPPFALMAVSPKPVFDVGPAGGFDCDGVNPSQVIETDGELALLYIGWRRGPAQEPYTLFAGLAVSGDRGRTFTRRPEPLLPPRPGERLFRTAPFIDRDAEGYRLLYIGGDAFMNGESGRRTPVYSLMELRGQSLWDWDGPARVLMSPDVGAGEVGFGRPVITPDRTLMLSLRTQAGYRLVETDLDFDPMTRPPLAPVIPPPFEPWEAGMTCFGAPCTVGPNELLFYNGDGYGRTGMGLAWRPRT
jgi:hypothetical protein